MHLTNNYSVNYSAAICVFNKSEKRSSNNTKKNQNNNRNNKNNTNNNEVNKSFEFVILHARIIRTYKSFALICL